MSIEFSFTVSGNAEALIAKAALWLDDGHLSDFTQDQFQEIMRDVSRSNLATESDKAGPWQPLSNATIFLRQMAGFPGEHPINERTGQMKNFLLNAKARGGPTGGGAEFEWPDGASGVLYMKLLRSIGWDKRAPARLVIEADQEEMDLFIREAFKDFEGFVKA